MSSSQYDPRTTLPPLAQAVPEFYTTAPHERRSSSVPRKFADRASPSLRPIQRLSPRSSHSNPDVSTAPSEPMDASYDAASYPFPGQLDSRRAGSVSHHPYARPAAPSTYFPPVSSLTSSRDSSLDMERDRPVQQLPLLYGGNPPPQSQNYQPFEERRQTPPEYGSNHRYTGSTGSYQTPSPVTHYAPYPSYSQQQRPHTSYNPRPTGMGANGGMSGMSMSGALGSPFPGSGQTEDYDNRQVKRRRGNLPKNVTDLLRQWLNDHLNHPYPSEDEKQWLMTQTGLTIHQISNWFINARRRRLPTMNQDKVAGNRRPSAAQ
ncbi:homeobox KN domain-containing protein [Pyronema omphalodes]|nr:homeobox KN domain-containing protein [Pyronema omphalodes]